ncbi:MAG: phosphopantetheine-binding protein [Opitutaceae bacterium]
MLPGAFVFVEAWPLTINGKIDREALLAPANAAPPSLPAAAPRGKGEQLVAQAYDEVLGCGAVGRGDNFFTLGGHSLLAAQLVSRLNRALGCALSVRDVFEQPTVSGLAQALGRSLETKTSRSEPAPRVVRRIRRPEMELVPPN